MNKTGKGHFRPLFDAKQIEIIRSCYEHGENLSQIARKVGCVRNTIKNYLLKQNIFKSAVRHTFNDKFFQVVDSESVAYWLGFAAADGCVRVSKKGHCFSIGLKRADKQHLLRFQELLAASHPVYDHCNISRGKKVPMSSISIWSKQLVNDLIAAGVTPCKSFSLKFPCLASHLTRHFVRGYFDGDGGWYLQKQKYPAFRVIGSKQFITHLQSVLVESCDLPRNKLLKTKHSQIIRVSYTGGHQCKKLFSYLYNDASIWLDRKKQKVETFLS